MGSGEAMKKDARAHALRKEIKEAKEDLVRKRDALKAIEDACRPHDWEDIDDHVDVRKAYTIPAWKAGVDFSPECHVPEKRTVYHRRRCVRCGLIEETTKTKVAKVERRPDFGTRT